MTFRWLPTKGDIFLNGIDHPTPRPARLLLGVYPQLTAIDVKLTVREDLPLYGRLRSILGYVLLRATALLNTRIGLQAGAHSIFEISLRREWLSIGTQRRMNLCVKTILDQGKGHLQRNRWQ